jgi:hypothetical protein
MVPRREETAIAMRLDECAAVFAFDTDTTIQERIRIHLHRLVFFWATERDMLKRKSSIDGRVGELTVVRIKY